MKKLAFIIFSVLLTVSLFTAAAHADADQLALRLKELGMFRGVGENADGTAVFDLKRAPTRAEALVMLVRALGKENAALKCKKSHPFTDVPDWADGYVSYAWDNKLTSGISETLFAPDAPVSAAMYMTFMLRALGYADTGLDDEFKYENGDFYWERPWALAAWCGILPPLTDINDFTRADVVNITCAAFYAKLKGADKFLYERLIAEGAFTDKQFRAAFSGAALSDYEKTEKMVSEYIRSNEHFKAKKNVAPYEIHHIFDIADDGALIKADALVCLAEVSIDGENVKYYGVYTMRLWHMEFDAATLECKSCLTSLDLYNQRRPAEELFSKKTVEGEGMFYSGIIGVGKLEAGLQTAGGRLAYSPLTYDEIMENNYYSNPFFAPVRTIETDACTILSWTYGGTMHGPYGNLDLIYKPGAAMGEGTIVSLPLPWANLMGTTAIAENLTLSDDKRTLYYSFYFDEPMLEGDTVCQEGGTFSYTVDLATGEARLEIK